MLRLTSRIRVFVGFREWGRSVVPIARPAPLPDGHGVRVGVKNSWGDGETGITDGRSAAARRAGVMPRLSLLFLLSSTPALARPPQDMLASMVGDRPAAEPAKVVATRAVAARRPAAVARRPAAVAPAVPPPTVIYYTVPASAAPVLYYTAPPRPTFYAAPAWTCGPNGCSYAAPAAWRPFLGGLSGGGFR